MIAKDANPVIELKSVNSAYRPDRQILFDVSFVLEPGARVLLLGPNGCGKSTLLKSIVGICKVLSGAVLHNGHDITGQQTSKIFRQGVAYLPQGDRVFSELTVRENLEVVLSGVGSAERRARIDRVASEVATIEAKLDRRASSLSGGEQQIVALARALLGGANVLLLDEPSLGLSPSNAEVVVKEVARVANDHDATIFMAEHNVRWASDVCDKYCAMKMGRLVGAGPTSDLIENDQLMRDIFL